MICTAPLNVAAVVLPWAKSAEPLPFVTDSSALSLFAALTFSARTPVPVPPLIPAWPITPIAPFGSVTKPRTPKPPVPS